MMKLLVLALTGFCLTQAMVTETHTADMDFLHKQKKIYDLFMYIDQSDFHGSEWYETGRNYDIAQHFEDYNDKMYVREFMYRFKLGMLKRGALFSVYYKEHREELRILFKLFYTAKDFATFYKTASWARHYMNSGMFVMALTTAVMYRPDCKYIVLPPMYEVYPHLFFDNEFIQEAHHYYMSFGAKKPVSEGYFSDYFMIDKNTTNQFMKYYMDKEYELSYFTDDVGLNNYYYYIRNVFPFWVILNDVDMPKHFRGEFYYYVHQQLMARYYLERLSQGFGEIEDFSFYKSFAPGFYSNLVYGNGVALPSRDRYSEVPYYKYKYINEIDNIESRILEAIDSGYFYDYEGKKYELYSTEGMNWLGNLIEGNYDSPNMKFYGAIDALYRDIFGFNFDCMHKNCFVPSALQIYSTSLRDPAFYRLYKRIIGYFLRYKTQIPAYTRSELEFPGIKIEDVKVDKLVTFMEPYEYFINNAVTVGSYKEGMSFSMKAKKYRLNYKPFTYHINVMSDKNTKGTVRIFLGPSMDDYYFKEQNYMYYDWYNFVELDKFMFEFKSGMNVIERHSTDSIYTAKDFMGTDMFYKKMFKSMEGSEPFTYQSKVYGFPDNLYLPMGKVGGMPFKLYVFIYPYEESKATYFDLPMFGKMFYDGKPFGFPLDRPMYPYFFDLSNMYFKDVYIHYDKEYSDYHFKPYFHEDMYSKHMDYMKYSGSYKNMEMPYSFKEYPEGHEYKDFEHKSFEHKGFMPKSFEHHKGFEHYKDFEHMEKPYYFMEHGKPKY